MRKKCRFKTRSNTKRCWTLQFYSQKIIKKVLENTGCLQMQKTSRQWPILIGLWWQCAANQEIHILQASNHMWYRWRTYQHSIVCELSKYKTVRYFFASRSETEQDRRRVQAKSKPECFQRRVRKARTLQKEHVGQQGDHLHGADESKYYFSVNCRCYSKKGHNSISICIKRA